MSGKALLRRQAVVKIIFFPFECNQISACCHSYRKVIGDLCKGGIEEQLLPETRPCPTKGTLYYKNMVKCFSGTVLAVLGLSS